MKDIQRDDIQTVADDLNIKVSRKKVNWIMENFDKYSIDNPTSDWVQVVEAMIYMEIDKRQDIWTYTVQELKDELSRRGFYVDTLWCVQDVFNKFDCSHTQAMDILESVLNSESITENIHDSIDYEGMDMGLKKLNDDED